MTILIVPFFCEHIATDCNFDPDFQYVLYFLILSVFCRSAEYFSVCFFPGRPSSFSCLDGKESPGGVAVGCYTRRVTDRAWTGIQSGGETPEGNAATMVREREFDSPGSDKIPLAIKLLKKVVFFLPLLAAHGKCYRFNTAVSCLT